MSENEDQKLIELFQRSRKGGLSPEEFNSLISSIFYTKKLLRVFLGNLKSANKSSLLLLFDVLERNINNVEEAERQEKESWQKRREALRKMNPKLDIKYRVDHYTKAQVLADDCYVKLKDFILARIVGEDATMNNIADLCCKIIDFEKKLDDSFMEAISKALDKVGVEDIADEFLGAVLSKSLLIMSRLRKNHIVSFRVVASLTPVLEAKNRQS